MIRFGWTSEQFDGLTYQDMVRMLYVLEEQAKIEEMERRKWKLSKR